ncbi:aminotransferase class IV [Luedemannella flava]|uniref:aminotransferase class IV n=1 Tax=Luedemannella flava TaxID=349316 RepID=UPI0031CEF85E
MLEQTTLAPPAEVHVVAVLGEGVVAPDAPILRADDLGALRGDGIFETLHVRAGAPWLLDEHLARMAGSAARLQLALPPEAELRELARQAVAAWPAQHEGTLRLICTRGAESGSAVTVFATVGPVAASIRKARREGVAVLTATQGFPADLRGSAPWLLGGAKTLSYAVNMACLRWATASGADDVLWTSTDGYALEAPTSTLVWLEGGTLWSVPAEATGILAGTTARWLLDHAGELGWDAAERLVTPAEVIDSDGAWLTSSVRGVAAIRTLDGTPLKTSPQVTDDIRNVLGFPS